MALTVTDDGAKGFFQRRRDKKILKELKKMEKAGGIVQCPFCERYRLPEDDCFCNEGS